jgi:hypothetical protein
MGESHMKREKYYDFLFDWSNVEKGHEFEGKTKECLAFLKKGYSEIFELPVPAGNQRYKEGMLTTLYGAIKWMERIIECNNPQNNYLSRLLFVKNTYHERHFFLKKIKNSEYARGQFRSASDLYKCLTNLTQSMAEFLQNNQISRNINESA